MKFVLNLVSCCALALWAIMPTSALHPAPAAATSPALDHVSCGESGVSLAGFSDALNKSAFGSFAVSELSAISFDESTGRYFAVADRAGTVRSHVFELSIPIPGIEAGVPEVVGVTVVNTPAGTPFTGANLDAEGLVVRKDGSIFVASEGGSAAGEQPEVHHFASQGSHLEALAVPAKFLIGPNNISFESLTESPGGNALFTANERPLAADGLTPDLRSRIRILRYDRSGTDAFAPAEEFFYLTEPGRNPGDLGVAELLAASPTSLLVLERGFVAGIGNTIRVFQVSLVGADDVADEPSLAASGLVPLEKTLLVDLADCPDDAATVTPGATQPNALLENFEGMTFGPELAGGMRSLVLLSDDNGSATQTTRLVVLAVPRQLLTPAP